MRLNRTLPAAPEDRGGGIGAREKTGMRNGSSGVAMELRSEWSSGRNGINTISGESFWRIRLLNPVSKKSKQGRIGRDRFRIRRGPIHGEHPATLRIRLCNTDIVPSGVG